MGNVVVFLQQNEGKLGKPAKVTVSAALKLKENWGLGDLIGVTLGKGAADSAKAAAELGLSKIFYSESESLHRYTAAAYTEAVLKVITENDGAVYLATATSTGKDFAPRVSATLEAGQASDVISINDDGSLKRPMYAGNVIADVEITTEKKVVTVRATAFDPAESSGGSAEVVEFSVEPDTALSGEVLGYEVAESERPELGDAEVVVSGGRALQSEENFEKYIFPLADALGGAVGASRAAVDSGFAPNDWQVGQTGKVVAPNLYIAIGISGAIQHVAGMKDSKTIVAINKDPDAPIFEIADYGLVADLYEVVEPLTEAIKKEKG